MGTSLLLTLAAESGTLQAGAAKIDIAPSVEAALPVSGCADREEGFKGVHNHIYARAIVLGDGSRLAAIVAWELIGVPNAVSEDLFSGLLGILAVGQSGDGHPVRRAFWQADRFVDQPRSARGHDGSGE